MAIRHLDKNSSKTSYIKVLVDDIERSRGMFFIQTL